MTWCFSIRIEVRFISMFISHHLTCVAYVLEEHRNAIKVNKKKQS